MVSEELIREHLQDQVENLALHRSQYKDLSDEDWQFFLQQIEGFQRTRDKLPLMGEMAKGLKGEKARRQEGEGWWYPPRISCEQCSSEATARYKAEVLGEMAKRLKGEKARRLIDLTGGAGVDTYFLSEQFTTVDYVEQNEELCRLAQHNLPGKVSIHNCSAEEWLNGREGEKARGREGEITIFIDPARRDKNGGKVFRLADCTPNVVELLPRMREVADTIMIKLSPMLDITQALRELGDDWEVHVVAVKNEVKEVLLKSLKLKVESLKKPSSREVENRIVAVDLAEGWKFEFTREEEEQTISQLANYELAKGYVYEPSAAILKAGAYKLVGARYGLEKLGVNTHLYVSEKLVNKFPGRIWKIIEVIGDRLKVKGEKANVLTRNYPLSAEQLKKKLRVKDGGEQYIIGTRIGEKPVVLVAERIELRFSR